MYSLSKWSHRYRVCHPYLSRIVIRINYDKVRKTGQYKMRGSDRIPPQYCKRIMRVLFAFVVLAVRTTIIRADGFLDVLSYLYRCRSKTFNECFERDLARTIDDMMGKNETYRLNRYLTMVVQNVTTGNRNSNGNVARSHDLSTRLLNLFNALHIQYQPEKPEYDFEGTMEFN